MPDDPVLAPWRRMRRAGLALLAACALLLPLFSAAIRHGWLDRHLRAGPPRDALHGIAGLLWLGLAGGALTALLAAIKLRAPPPR